MRGSSYLLPLALVATGLVLILVGIPGQLNLAETEVFHVSEPYLALSNSDLVVAYSKYSPNSAIYITKLDESLTSAFRDVRVSPNYGISVYPKGPSVKTGADGVIHILWTLNNARLEEPECLLSLQYSRLSVTGELLVENRSLGYAEGADSCGKFLVNWTLEAGEPVVHNITLEWPTSSDLPFDLDCYFNCLPSGATGADGTWYVVTAHLRRETIGTTAYTRTHIALYSFRAGEPGPQKLATLASNDPLNPVDLPETRLSGVFSFTGAAVVGAGFITLALLWHREKPELLQSLMKWIADNRNLVLAWAGIGSLAISSLLPWFRGWPPSPHPLAFFEFLTRGILINTLTSVAGLVLVEALLLGALLVNRSYLLIRSINIAVLIFALPILFFGCCFKSAPGFDVGVAIGLIGVVLVHASSKRLQAAQLAPRVRVPLWVSLLASSAFGFVAVSLLFIPSLFALFTTGGLLAGIFHYVGNTVLWTVKGQNRND